MFRSIVVGVDGSEHAAKALRTAAELAVRDSALLGIVYVVDKNYLTIPDNLRRMAEVEHINHPTSELLFNVDQSRVGVVRSVADTEACNQKAMSQLADFILNQSIHNAREQGVRDVTGVVEQGSPASMILEFAEQRKADLIVTGSRGFGPLKSFLLGSTSLKIVQLATCSCITIK